MSKYAQFSELDGSHIRIGLVRARWNGEITKNLENSAGKTLQDYNVTDDRIVSTEVPGSFELSWKTQTLAYHYDVDAIVAIGCLIQGSTPHFDYLANAVTNGLTEVSLRTEVPVVFGVLTCLNEEQARERSEGEHDHGPGWAKTAIELGSAKRELKRENSE